MTDHKIVDLGDRTERTVLDGEDPEFAKTGFHCLEYAVKCSEIHDVSMTEDLVCRNLRIGTFNTLTGNHRCFGKFVGSVLDSFFYLVSELSSGTVFSVAERVA